VSERILIIDDDLDTLKLVGLMLEREGFEIIVASNGVQGLAKAASEHPDLILLDVMMPEVDGYEVARRLQADPQLDPIPVIMFTAKSMIDDKVKGFEVGVDDYLTKPTHPAELSAHVKAILARVAQAVPYPADQGKVIGFLGVRGGMGTSTLALNIGVALHQAGQTVIIAEMNPGRGSMALELGFEDFTGISNILTQPEKEIHLKSVEAALENHTSGVRLLLSSHRPAEMDLQDSLHKMVPVIGNLSSLADVVVLDFGSAAPSSILPILETCDLIVLVMEPIFPSTAFGLALVEDLEKRGIDRKKLNLALITRMRTSIQIPWREIEAQMGIDFLGMLPPAADMAHQASRSTKPLITVHSKGIVSDRIRKLAEELAKNARLAPAGDNQ
jgi:DNA-binding response OmpR family regulator